MPFVALNKITGARIDITETENPKLTLKKDDLVCQLCKKPLMIRGDSVRLGYKVRAHFAHHSESDCDTEYQSHPETIEHREAKIKLVEFLKATYNEYSVATLEKEVPIPEIKRVADVLATFPMGWRIAHEIQLAGISKDELKERTNDYFRAGIDVIWWLGKTANNVSNRTWCIENFGYCFTIEVDKQVDTKPENLL